MSLILQNMKGALRFVFAFAFLPFATVFLLWSDYRSTSTGVKIRGAWLSFWIRAWERAGDLTEKRRVDTAVLFSSFVLFVFNVTLICDRHYLDRYDVFALMRTYMGGYPFWLCLTGTLSAVQFVTAFCYGMRGVNRRRWEVAVVLSTGVAAATFIIMHDLIAHFSEGIASRMFLGLCVMNIWYAASFGFARAIERDRAKLEPLSKRPVVS